MADGVTGIGVRQVAGYLGAEITGAISGAR